MVHFARSSHRLCHVIWFFQSVLVDGAMFGCMQLADEQLGCKRLKIFKSLRVLAKK